MDSFEDNLARSFVNAQDQTGDYHGENFNDGVVSMPVAIEAQVPITTEDHAPKVATESPLSGASQDAMDRITGRYKLQGVDPILERQLEGTTRAGFPIEPATDHIKEFGKKALSGAIGFAADQVSTPHLEKFLGEGMGKIAGKGVGIVGGALSGVISDVIFPKNAY